MSFLCRIPPPPNTLSVATVTAQKHGIVLSLFMALRKQMLWSGMLRKTGAI